MRVAIVHDWLTVFGGAERVLKEILHIYPEADLFALVDYLKPDDRDFIDNKRVTTSFIQNLPLARKWFRIYLPLFPLAIEQLDLRDYDLVISSSFAVAKGVMTSAEQVHVCFCHSPMRYVWDMREDYLTNSKFLTRISALPVRYVLHRLRRWDVLSATNVDFFVANSRFVRRRIRKYYGEPAWVVYPPVDVNSFDLTLKKSSDYVTVSRLVAYKRVDLIVEAFRAMPNRRLIVIGDGPDEPKVRAAAADASNITILGYQPSHVVKHYLEDARAFIFAAKEDFGIAPIEAQACGTPVLAFGEGGARETIISPAEGVRPTGLFFDRQDAQSIIEAVECFEATADRFSPNACRMNAERFSTERFWRELEGVVSYCLQAHRREIGTQDQPLPIALADTAAEGTGSAGPLRSEADTAFKIRGRVRAQTRTAKRSA